jgi:extradiol dioxygenase family protein
MRRSLAFLSASLGISICFYTNGAAAPPDTGSVAAPSAALQPATTQPTAALPGTVTLPTVEVRGRAEDLLGIADTSNQGYVGHDEIERRPLLRPAEILEAVPGLVITQHSGPGKANQYFLRGFQLDHGTDFAVTLNGVPQNLPSHAHGQGYLDLNYVIPEIVDDIRYRKGPYFADVGDFSAAGSADIQYVNSLPYNLFYAESGSYGYARALAVNNFTLGRGKLLTALEYEYEDGPWDVPDRYQKLNAVLRYSQGNESDGFSITSTNVHSQWTATNQIAQRVVEDGLIDRFGSLNPSDGGNSQRYTVSVEGHEKTDEGQTSVLGWGTWYDMDLFNDFTYFLFDPVHGDQFEQQDRRFYGGLRASHTFFGSLVGRSSDTTVGLQFRDDDINNSLHHTEDRRRIGLIRSDDIDEPTIGVYLENRTQWTDWFRTEGSLRGDYFYFDVRSDNPANSGDVQTAIFSPKLNLIFGPWDKTEFYISGGYGFHSNDARGITTTEVPSTLVPAERVTPLARAIGGEVGLRTKIVPHLNTELSLWGLDLTSEEVFDGDTAETVPSGPTRRIGIEFANYYTPTDWLTIDADYAISQARYRDHEAAGDYVPESIVDVFESGVTVHDMLFCPRLFGSMRVRYFGPRALTQNDSVNSNSSTIVNAQVGYHFNERLTAKVDFLNLFNANTNDIEYDYTSRLQGEPAAGKNDIHLHPAEPFEVRAGIEYRY